MNVDKPIRRPQFRLMTLLLVTVIAALLCLVLIQSRKITQLNAQLEDQRRKAAIKHLEEQFREDRARMIQQRRDTFRTAMQNEQKLQLW